MLDPNRIECISKKLKALWTYYPDWQIHQVIELVKCGCEKCLSDKAFEARLDQLIEMSESMNRSKGVEA